MSRRYRDLSPALAFYLIGHGGEGGQTPEVPTIGDWVTIVTDTSKGYLTEKQMEVNARLIYNVFAAVGWSSSAIAALLGNMQGESTLNPGLIEVGGGTTSAGAGRGLVQWTPASNLYDVLDVLYQKHDDWYDGNKQCQVIYAEYQESVGEAHRGIEPQWYKTSAYPISWDEWAHSTERTIQYLTQAFMANYERPATTNHPERWRYAQYWYEKILEWRKEG